jgi:hypothetical protein
VPSAFLNPSRIVVASGTLIGGTVGLASTAFAVPPSLDCGPGATAISATVCEADFTSVGTATWTPPANVDTIEALIVGGGGSSGQNGNFGYGGGGGDVKVVTLDNTGDITVRVGGSDTASSTTQGSTTNTVAPGGSGDNGGYSGNGNAGAAAGGGAGGTAVDTDGGAGIIISSLSSSLFLNDSDCFGGGGAVISYIFSVPPRAWNVGTSTCGGGYTSETSDVASLHAAIANSGGGGAAKFQDVAFLSGASGRVTIRFTLTETVLARTGSNAKPLAELGIFLMVLGSVGYFAGRRRTKA